LRCRPASWPAAHGAPRSRCARRAPTPAESLGLEVEAFGPPAQDQGRLLDEAAAVRRARLGEAVRQARQAAGAEAALKVLDVDPGSRVPERRAVLAPFPEAPQP
jgi:protein ImuB